MIRFNKTLSGILLVMMICMVMTSALAVGTTPVPTLPPTSGTIEGVVASVEKNDILINMNNGNTIRFMLSYISEPGVVVGDTVKIKYSGDVASRPEAVGIEVTKAAEVQTISGEVVMHDKESIFVMITSKDIFGFIIDAGTKVTGKAASVVTGDQVKVVYDGDLYSIATASVIEITEAVKNRKETVQTVPTENKILDGTVTRLSDKIVALRTGKGKTYTFKINSSTQITGNYDLEMGSRITVTYDGYATKKPNAKKINVIAAPDPTPTQKPVKTKTTTGTVSSFYGAYLTLENGTEFDCTGASFSGNSCGNPGDSAKVVYYTREDGILCATKVSLNAQQPTPTKSKTTSGEVVSFGGMYLSLNTGIGFDCAYASYSGNGNREPGDWVNVTYYVGDDGVNYATHLKFTATDASESAKKIVTDDDADSTYYDYEFYDDSETSYEPEQTPDYDEEMINNIIDSLLEGTDEE